MNVRANAGIAAALFRGCRLNAPRSIMRAWDEIIPGTETPESNCMTCPFLKNDSCGVCDNRPFMCRLWGAVDHPGMKCPWGCGPRKPLSDEEAKKLLDEYKSLTNTT